MKKRIIPVLLAVSVLCAGLGIFTAFTLSRNVPPEYALAPFTDKAYVTVNGGRPNIFWLTKRPFEKYSDLDGLGRCGTAYANICGEIMPEEPRAAIGKVKPSGWQTVRYDFIDELYLYNRCHLIGYQLSGENANKRNLITGTRYLNIEGMLPIENRVAAYVKGTGNHVLYRVTPVYRGSELVARGVHIEARSVEDRGEGISINVYCYNVQPGVEIDYATGKSKPDGTIKTTPSPKP